MKRKFKDFNDFLYNYYLRDDKDRKVIADWLEPYLDIEKIKRELIIPYYTIKQLDNGIEVDDHDTDDY